MTVARNVVMAKTQGNTRQKTKMDKNKEVNRMNHVVTSISVF